MSRGRIFDILATFNLIQKQMTLDQKPEISYF